MIPKNILKDVEMAIKNRSDSYTGKWRLILEGEKIICLPVRFRYKQERYIRAVNDEDAEGGFTGQQWDEISRRVLQIQEGNKKCQHHPKPLL